MDRDERKIAGSLLMDIGAYETSLDMARERLYRETEKQSLRNTDLAELTGWSTSKTSKVTAGKQKLTADDVKTWARALGYTPDPFISDNIDIRYYHLSAYIRPLKDCIEAYFDAMEGEAEYDAIVNYELPLAILTSLHVKVSDYAVRTRPSHFELCPLPGQHGHKAPSTYITFWARATKEADEMTPAFGIWFEPGNEYYLMAVYLDREEQDYALKTLRAQYKDALQIEQKYTDEFDEFAERHADWVPKRVRNGEIIWVGDSTNFLPDPPVLDSVWIDLFKKYCGLVWEVKGMDLLPDSYKVAKENDLPSYDQFNMLNGYADFDIDVKEKVLKREDFRCEMDPEHGSFEDAMGRVYMEVAPLIPFYNGLNFGKVALSDANAVCLCPNCRARLKYGKDDDREDMFVKLYRKHRSEMRERGLDVSLSQILAFNGLE